MNTVLGRLLIIITLFSSVFVTAQIDEKEYPIAPIQLNGFSQQTSVSDPEAGWANQHNKDPYCYARLRVDNTLPPYIWYEFKATFLVTPLLADGTVDTSVTPREEVLSLSYNPHSAATTNTLFTDVSFLQVKNRYGMKISLIPGSVVYKNLVNNTTSNYIPENIFLDLGLKVKRYYTVSDQLPNPVSTITNLLDSATGTMVPGSIKIEWQKLTGALEYELEWTWVDSYSDTGATDNLAANAINFSDRDFELNNTRILTKSNSYEIPLLYAKGYLIYRVRAVGLYPELFRGKYYGKWSSGTASKTKVSDWPHIAQLSEHEKNKNWQLQVSYAENGKKKEVISYFDGSLRNRQTVTKINTDKNAIVGEVIYDAQGRPAVEVLPTPVNENSIRYFKNHNKNQSDTSYSYKDFDFDSTSDTICNVQVNKMDSGFGAARYYSSKSLSDFPNSIHQEYVPDAQNYPFSQIEYTPDNTGRIARKGGVGYNHQLGSGHEMQYLYTTPTDKEINRLFGYSVGDVSHYKKNIVIDPNRQVSVSYIDPQGRTIATALSDDPKDNLDKLEDAGNDNPMHGMMEVDLLGINRLESTGNFPVNNDKLVVSKQLAVGGNRIAHEFDYTVNQTQQFTPASPENCNRPVYPFVYDLKINLKDQCQEDKIAVEKIKLGSASNPFPYQSNPSTFFMALNSGSYTLLKELKVNAEQLNEYATDYISKLRNPNNSCYVNPNQFSPNISLDMCNMTCTSCTAAIGTPSNYIINSLSTYYSVPAATFSLPTNLTAPISVTISGNTSIDQTQANGLANRFFREWQLLKQECDQLCPAEVYFDSSCTVNEQTLLGDVSPFGQYGITKSTILNANGQEVANPDFELSVFNQQGKLYRNGAVTGNNWKNSSLSYKDIDGNDAYVIVIPNGDGTYTPAVTGLVLTETVDGTLRRKVKPQQLVNYADFVEAWDLSWAKSLLIYHPEYPYLEYNKEVCKLTKNVQGTSTIIAVNSDGYDSYLQNVKTFNDAVSKGLIGNNLSAHTGIYTNDPYFQQLPAAFESAALFGYRTGIMQEAINSDYLSDGTTVLKLYQAALQAAYCNPLVQCNLPTAVSSLTTEQKDVFWKTYRSLYIGLKSKIKHVFSNIYAIEKGSYNGCIGGVLDYSVTNVLTDNFSQKASLFNYIYSISVPSLCASTSGILYKEKTKRFIPVDFGYDSGVDPQTALDQLQAQNDYEYYTQTGNCPLLFDFEYFISGFFKDASFTGQNITALSSRPFTGQYVTADLIKALGSAIVPLNSLNISSATANNTLTINFNSSPSQPFCGTTVKVDSSEYTWANYNTTWKIKNIKQCYYDSAASVPANQVFAYKAVAVILVNGTEKEVVLYGTTCAPIGECSTDHNNQIGQVLDPNAGTSENGNSCTKKYQFRQAFVAFINQLKQTGQLQSTTPVNLDNVSSYKNSYLATFFNEPANSPIQTTWISNQYGYGMSRAGETIFSLDQTVNLSTLSTYPFSNVTITSNGSIDIFTFHYPNASGAVQSATGRVKPNLNYDCCADGKGYVPLLTLRKEISQNSLANGKLTYSDIYFTPLDLYIQNNEVLDIQVTMNTNNASSDLKNDYTVSLFINNKEYSFEKGNLSFSLQSGVVNELYRLPAINRISWNKYYGAGFEMFNLYYKINGNTRTFPFTEGSGNPTAIENSAIAIKLPQGVNYSSWLTNPTRLWFNKLLANTTIYDPTEAYWEDNGLFRFKPNTPLSFTVKTKMKLTEPLFYFGPNDTFGHFLSLTSDFEQNNVPNSEGYTIMLSAQSAKTGQCTTCLTQPVVPVACDAKKADFLNFILHGGPNNGPRFSDYDVQANQFDNFCANNLQYIVDSYKYYCNQLAITSSYDFNFRTIAEFGNTYLHYGFNQINSVIDAYKGYYTANAGNPDRLNWNNWVNTLYKDAHPEICPPASLGTYSPELPADNESTCVHLIKNLNETYQQEAYDNYLESLRKKFIKEYTAAAMATVKETFKVNYFDKEYQYTLYYYDQAGNLTQTVAPEGVKRFTPDEINTKNTAINTFKNNFDPLAPNVENTALQPQHTFKTQYRYNTLNQLVWQKTPDGGETRFAYDALGRIIASQNAKQYVLESSIKRMSYTVYDNLGRIIEVGQIVISGQPNQYGTHFFISDEGRLMRSYLTGGNVTNQIVNGFPEEGLMKVEVTRTVYGEAPQLELYPESRLASDFFYSNYNPQASRNRVTGIFAYDEYIQGEELDFINAIVYNYDIHGNVKETLTYIPTLKDYYCDPNVMADAALGLKNDCELHIKRVVYDYDLISGNVNSVTLQPGRADQFIHQYEYDADNRIVAVKTSPDGIVWENDANYKYYAHGPLARVELGDKKVQGIDYAYTLQGWLKAVNGENLAAPENDMGLDGTASKKDSNKDAFGYSLTYFDGDYKAIATEDNGDAQFKPLMFSRDNGIAASGRNLYNGNIKQMTTAIRTNREALLDVQKNNYTYDQLNRITGMTSVAITPNATGAADVKNESYTSRYTYDRNGNLKTLSRTAPDQNGAFQKMDDLSYDYLPGNNKLRLVKDKVQDSNLSPNDLEDQVRQLAEIGIVYNINNLNTHNYIYDEIGQLVADKTEGLKINWRVDGKVQRITKNKNGAETVIYFEYDGLGNRISKNVVESSFGDPLTNSDYYSRDAQGNVLAVYRYSTLSNRNGISKNYYIKEHHIFGSSRLGLEDKLVQLYKYKKPEIIGPLAHAAQAGNAATASAPSVPQSVSDLKIYSLNVTPSTNATWNEPYLTTVNSNVDTVALTSKFKISQTATPPASTLIGQVEIMGQGTYIDHNKTIVRPPLNVMSNINIEADGTITRTVAGDSWGDVGGSTPYLLTGDGYVERTIKGPLASNEYVMLGLSYSDPNVHYNTINYAFYTFGSNILYAYENSVRYTLPTGNDLFAIGDLLRVERRSGKIRYFKNNTLVREVVESQPGQPMLVDFALYRSQTKIYDLKVVKYNIPYVNANETIINPQLTRSQNVAVDASGKITKTSMTDWNSGGETAKLLVGNGYVERIIGGTLESNYYVMLGLSYQTDTEIASPYTINYAMYSYMDGRVMAYENGVNQPLTASFPVGANYYKIGDVLRVERINSKIKYFINGILLHTLNESAANAGQPMLVDFSIIKQNSSIYNLKVVNYDAVPQPENYYIITKPPLTASQNVAVDANGKITKTSPQAWDAGGETAKLLVANGYVERTIGGTLESNHNIMLGLSYQSTADLTEYRTINYALYSYMINNKVMAYENGVNRTLLGSFPVGTDVFKIGDVLRLERLNGKIKFYNNGILLHTLNEAAANAGQPMLVDFSMPNQNSSIYNLKIVNYVMPQQVTEGNIKTGIQLFADYQNSTFKPKAIVTKEVFANGITTKKQYTIANLSGLTVTAAEMKEKGMQVSFEGKITPVLGSDSIEGGMAVNGSQNTAFNRNAVTSTSATAPTAPVSKLGAGTFDICSVNYSLGSPVNTLTREFDFNNNVGTGLNNPPVSASGNITMTVSPAAVRVLGPCLTDTDGDGLY
ncbi:hypothetical protein, partial [Flavobacterium sp. UBA4197]|uniref:DUF6443 domain-containing protein n=1 Tax=Flavobacterium sp. UBA4197 TaxID=1946546 RepID=UPI00257EE0FF